MSESCDMTGEGLWGWVNNKVASGTRLLLPLFFLFAQQEDRRGASLSTPQPPEMLWRAGCPGVEPACGRPDCYGTSALGWSSGNMLLRKCHHLVDVVHYTTSLHTPQRTLYQPPEVVHSLVRRQTRPPPSGARTHSTLYFLIPYLHRTPPYQNS